MIQGDIDLTEKLDFYHDKPKEKLLPAIPWKKDTGVITADSNVAYTWITNYLSSNPRISVVNSDVELAWNNFDIDYNTYSTTSFNTTISTNNSNRFTFTYNSWNDEPITNFNSTTATTTISWTSNNNWNSVITTFDGEPISYKTKIDTPKRKPLDLPYKVKPKEDYKSPIIYCDYCGKKFIRVGKGYKSTWFCKDCEERKNKKILNEKSFKDLKRKSLDKEMQDYFSWGDNELFPWDNDGIYSHHDEIIDSAVALRELKRRVGNASKRLRDIPWLKDLSSRIFNDYKEELEDGEKDYSSYLTDMGWLGIH